MKMRKMTIGELRALVQGKIPVYDNFEEMPHGFFKVTLKGKEGLLNSKYEMVLQPIYEYVDVISKTVVIASRQIGVHQIFSERGIPLTPREFVYEREAKTYGQFFK